MSAAGATNSFRIGEAFGGLGSILKEFGRAGAHALAQGSLSHMQGGSFWQGAASGGLSSIGGSGMQALGFSDGPMIFGSASLGGLGSKLAGGDFFQGFATGLFVGAFNHAMEHIQGEISESRAKRVMKEYYALVAGESSDDYDEARAIGEVILKRAEEKGVKLKPGWTSKLGKFDAIGGTEFTDIMEMDFDKIVCLQPKDKYYIRIKGADDAFWNPSADYSKGAWFFNATFQKYEKNKGFNFNTYESGVFVITAELGKTTFFKYAKSGKKWP